MSGPGASSLGRADAAHLAWLGSVEAARLRWLPERLPALVSFHAGSKLLLLAHSEVEMRCLGRVIANAAGLPPWEVARLYREGFARALSAPASPGRVVNALQHAAGHFSRVLDSGEKGRFAGLLDDFAAGRVGLKDPLAVLRAWLVLHPVPWLEGQSLLRPYAPRPRDVTDPATFLASVPLSWVA